MWKNANFKIIYIYGTHMYICILYIMYVYMYAVVFIEWIKRPGGREAYPSLYRAMLNANVC